MLGSIDSVERSPVGDPSDCKACPQWNDCIGRCMIPPADRYEMCGSVPPQDIEPDGFDLYRKGPVSHTLPGVSHGN
jgi:hypothetical protein